VVEIRAEHLVGHGSSWEQGFAKIELPDVVSALARELGPELLRIAPFLDLIVNPKLVEQHEVLWQKRFAHVEPGKTLLLENGGLVASLTKVDGSRGACGAATDNGDVARVSLHEADATTTYFEESGDDRF
jgi:hypothetical protein